MLDYERSQNKKYKNKIIKVGDDPSYGYDILSFDEQGNEKHIEVKTSSHGDIDKVDFYITSNEYSKLKTDPYYFIYYVCGMNNRNRKIVILTLSNLEKASFEPIAYKITAKIED